MSYICQIELQTSPRGWGWREEGEGGRKEVDKTGRILSAKEEEGEKKESNNSEQSTHDLTAKTKQNPLHLHVTITETT